MKRLWIPTLLSFAFLPLFGVNAPVWAQDVDNDAIAAVKKAALIIVGKGIAPIKPTNFYMKVEVFDEGKGRSATQAEYQRSVETLRNALEKAGFRSGGLVTLQALRPTGEASFQVDMGPASEDAPNDTFKIVGNFSFGVATPEKARQAFAVMRGTGVSGNVTVYYSIDDEEAAHRAALKVAIAQAKQRVQILSEAAKPKEFELIYLKEGDSQAPSATTFARLEGKEPFGTLDTISADIDITLFYGFKPVTVTTSPKVATTPKAIAKSSKKP